MRVSIQNNENNKRFVSTWYETKIYRHAQNTEEYITYACFQLKILILR